MNTPSFVDAALALRRSHAQVSAREVLDLVMQGHSTAAEVATSGWLKPSHPFAALVCEAFDLVMTIDEWRVLTSPQQAAREALLDVWRRQVVARFLARYASGGAERSAVVAASPTPVERWAGRRTL